MQARGHGGGLGAVGGGEPLWVHVGLAVGGGVAQLGHSKVHQHLQGSRGGRGGSHREELNSCGGCPWPSPAAKPAAGPGPPAARLRGVAQPPRVQPGLQHAVLDEHQVCLGRQQKAAMIWRAPRRTGAAAAACRQHVTQPAAATQAPGDPPLRRSGGVASTTACRSSLRVQTTMGPGGPATGSPRRTSTSAPAPMSASACPTRPPPTITNGCGRGQEEGRCGECRGSCQRQAVVTGCKQPLACAMVAACAPPAAAEAAAVETRRGGAAELLKVWGRWGAAAPAITRPLGLRSAVARPWREAGAQARRVAAADMGPGVLECGSNSTSLRRCSGAPMRVQAAQRSRAQQGEAVCFQPEARHCFVDIHSLPVV